LKVYEIDSIHNLNPEDEPFDAMDTPFYEIGCEKEEQEKGKLPVCIENILVELD
jgi:ASC-1-like (ASCH) protein